MLNKKLLVLCAIVVLVCLPGWGQGAETTKPIATGVVRTASGVPVPGAAVRLIHAETGHAWLSWTDDEGKFALPGLPAGKYRIDVQQLGFESATLEYTFPSSVEEKRLEVAHAL